MVLGVKRKRNAQSFEGCQWTIINLKLVFLQSLYEWMQALGSVSFSSLLDLIVFCTLGLGFAVLIVYFLCTSVIQFRS